MRSRMAIGIIDAYYDDRGQALCPMATGISHHISPRGDIEPCPIIQFATENIRDGESVFQLMRGSAFLADFRELSARATRGCVVLERPDLVRELVIKHGARDTTLRGTAMAELESMTPRSSQYLPGAEIPEEQWFYRLAKKYWFNDFGAYQRPAKFESADDADGRRFKLPKDGNDTRLNFNEPAKSIAGLDLALLYLRCHLRTTPNFLLLPIPLTVLPSPLLFPPVASSTLTSTANAPEATVSSAEKEHSADGHPAEPHSATRARIRSRAQSGPAAVTGRIESGTPTRWLPFSAVIRSIATTSES